MSFVAEQSLVGQNVKEEPEWESLSKETFIRTDSVMSIEEVCVKEERCTNEEMARTSLYIDHEVKRDLVLGPELLQSPFFVPSVNELVTIKPEPSGEGYRATLEEQFELRKCSVRLERIPHIQKRHLKYNSHNNNSSNMSELSINAVVNVEQDPSDTESSKRLEAKFALRRCSVRLKCMPQRILERYLKYNSNKKNLNKQIIAFTYYTCHICNMQFAEAKNLKVPYTCKMCYMTMKNPNWQSHPKTKSDIYNLIPESILIKCQSAHKKLLKEKQQWNMPTGSGRWRSSPSSGTQKAIIIFNNKYNNNNTDSLTTSTKYNKNKINLRKERILAMDQLKKLTDPPIYSCNFCMKTFPRKKDWLHHINNKIGNICRQG